MYSLILTHEERKAIDWIGNRYATGDELYRLLSTCERTIISSPPMWDWLDGGDWIQNVDIQFNIPEHIAWQIKELFEQEELTFPCFSEGFKSKLLEWYWRIV